MKSVLVGGQSGKQSLYQLYFRKPIYYGEIITKVLGRLKSQRREERQPRDQQQQERSITFTAGGIKALGGVTWAPSDGNEYCLEAQGKGYPVGPEPQRLRLLGRNWLADDRVTLQSRMRGKNTLATLSTSLPHISHQCLPLAKPNRKSVLKGSSELQFTELTP